MLARLFVLVGGLLVVVLCSLLLAPFFVDWAGYRSAFEREASRIIGQPVRVEGTAKARILPFPSVTFSNVVIDGPDGTPAARIAAFSMDAELAPFVSGEILIFDMRIERPDVRLMLAANGAPLWSAAQNDVLRGKTVALENVTITGGRVSVERAGQDAVLFNNVEGKVSARSLAGPWQADGTFVYGATSYDAKLSTGAKISGETLRTKLSFGAQGGLYQAVFDGQLGTKNNAPVYEGALDVDVLGNLLDASGKRPTIAAFSGNFAATANDIIVKDAVLVTGTDATPYRADGTARLSSGKAARFDVSLKGQQISVGSSDADPEATGVSNRETGASSLIGRFDALQNALAQIPMPQIPGAIDLALPAIIIGDTIIRNVQLTASPAQSGWQIERYGAELPGRTNVEGQGALILGSKMGFTGQMILASKQPTGFANWLGLEVNNAIRTLPSAGLSSTVDLSTEGQYFRDIELRAGNLVMRGAASRQILQGAKPRVTIELAGSNANLDLLSGLELSLTPDIFASLNHDVSLNLSSAPVSGFGLQAEKINAQLQLSNGSLAIDQLDVSGISGADVKASGLFSNIASKPQMELDVAVIAADPLPFMDMLAQRFPSEMWMAETVTRAKIMGIALADSTMRAAINVSDQDPLIAGLNGNVTYDLDSAGVTANGSGTLNLENFSLTANGSTEIGETLLAGLGLEAGYSVTALDVLAPTKFDVYLAGQAGKITDGSLRATSNQDIFETRFGSGRQAFNLKVADAAAYANAAGFTLPGVGYSLPLQMKGSWEQAGNALKLHDIAATFVDMPMTADLTFSAREQLKIGGIVGIKALDRGVFDEIMFGPFAAGTDATAEFSNDINLPFDLDLALAVEEATGFAPLPIKQAKTRIVTNDKVLQFTDITANIAGAKLAGFAEARKNGPEAAIGFNGSIMNADLQTVFGIDAGGQADLQIQLSANGATMKSLKASIAGSGQISARNIVLDGINVTGFRALVAEADLREAAPDAIASLELVERHLMAGQLPLENFQTAFTITSGAARAARTVFDLGGAQLVTQPKIDLITGQAEIDAQILFKDGNDLTTGAEPQLNLMLKGQWNETSLSVDTQLLQGFLSQRALEREEARVAAIQSDILEKQRLRRENRYYAGLIDARAKAEVARLEEVARFEELEIQAEIARIAEAERIKTEAAEQEKSRLAKEAARLNAISNPNNSPSQAEIIETPAMPLNLDQLIRQLETPLPVQP